MYDIGIAMEDMPYPATRATALKQGLNFMPSHIEAIF